MADGGQFEKDFAYLMPFLDKIAEAVAAADASRREELLSLIEGEKSRWTRIRDLLSADKPKGTQTAGSIDLNEGRAPLDSPETPRFQFTVGSLRNRP